MRITLVRFRCYVTPYTREFSLRKLTLINGKSGIGKTTILEGVLWCLYGGTTHIYPSGTTGSQSSPTCVLLEFEELGGVSIRRIHPPHTIEVQVPGSGILTGIAAQAYIETIFGPKEFYITSSYIQQNARCPLITGSNVEKTQLLHELTFGSHTTSERENPETYLSRIETELLNLKHHIGIETGKYNAKNQAFTSAYQTHHQMYATWTQRQPPDATIATFELEVQTLQAQRTKLELQIVDLIGLESKVQTLEDQRRRLGVMTRPIDPQLDVKLELVTTAIIQASKYESLETEIARLTSALVTFDLELATFDSQRLIELKAQLERIRQIHMAARRLGFEYTQRQTFITTETQKLKLSQQDELSATEAIERDALITTYNLEFQSLHAAHTKQVELEALKDFDSQMSKYEAETQRRQRLMVEYHTHLLNHQHYVTKIDEFRRHSQMYSSLRDALTQSQLQVEASELALNHGFEWYLSEHVTSGTAIDMAHLDATLQKLQGYKQQLYCPHCKGSVMYLNGNLTPGIVDLETALKCDDQIRRIVEYAHKLKAHEQLKVQHQRLTQEFKGYTSIPQPPSPHPAFEIKPSEPHFETLIRPSLKSTSKHDVLQIALESRVSKAIYDSSRLMAAIDLEVELNDPDQLDQQIRSIEDAQHLLPIFNRLQTLKAQMALMDHVNLDQLKAEKAEIVKQITEFTRLAATYLSFETQASSLDRELRDLKFDSEALKVAQDQKLDLEASILKATHMIEAFKIYEDLRLQNVEIDLLKHQLLKMAEYESSLLKLKTLIQEVASNAMEETVDAINYTCNAILHEIFEADIQVVLKTHKELKTRDTTKLQVNLQVIYKSHVYDSPSRLSGGEQDRISLALTLAMAKLSSSPLLLLDEPMASINDELRELCLEAMQLHLPDKTILHVCHSAIKGQHDCAVEMCCDEET